MRIPERTIIEFGLRCDMSLLDLLVVLSSQYLNILVQFDSPITVDYCEIEMDFK